MLLLFFIFFIFLLPTKIQFIRYTNHFYLKIYINICLCVCLCVSQLELEKQKGESLGVVIVESGWGSILPTVILANMLNSGPAARSGKLSVGDQIMSINNTSLVGLPLATCQGIIKVWSIQSTLLFYQSRRKGVGE